MLYQSIIFDKFKQFIFVIFVYYLYTIV